MPFSSSHDVSKGAVGAVTLWMRTFRAIDFRALASLGGDRAQSSWPIQGMFSTLCGIFWPVIAPTRFPSNRCWPCAGRKRSKASRFIKYGKFVQSCVA
eukprot:scaffold504_cov240-Pinguiococcus_pyrenoidosus.AAC.6